MEQLVIQVQPEIQERLDQLEPQAILEILVPQEQQETQVLPAQALQVLPEIQVQLALQDQQDLLWDLPVPPEQLDQQVLLVDQPVILVQLALLEQQA
jgi:hypothetical protein